LIIGGVLALSWAVLALWAVPALIRSAYAGESLPLFNRLIQGQAQTPVEEYLGLWRRMAWNVTRVVVGLAAYVLVGIALVKRMRKVHAQAQPGTPPLGARDVLLTGVWIGIVAGLAEATNGIIRHRLQHLPTGEIVSAELFWMAPLAAVTTFTVIGLLFLALDRTLPARFRLFRFAPALFAGLAVYSLLRALTIGLANIAVLILALGVAVAALRLITASPASIRWLARTTTPWMAGALVAWMIAVPVWRRVVEGRSPAGLAQAEAGVPNVLIIIWDTARALNLSLHGYHRETTPELEQLGRRGVVFDRAFATASWSLPSHGSIFTGRYPQEMTVGRQIPLDETHPTLAEVLARRGYVTGGFTANLFYGSRDYGIARGFSWYDSRPPMKPTVVAHTWWLTRTVLFEIRTAAGRRQTMLRRRASDVNEAFLAWLSRHADRPFLAVLNHFDAHEPYQPPEPFNLAFSDSQPRYWFSSAEDIPSRDVLDEFITAYDSSIRYVDHELGRLLQTLADEGRLDNTIVIVTADHGEDFGEQGEDVYGHARSVSAASLLVPLVVVYPPRIDQGIRVSDAVSIRDIPATVMDLLGLADDHPFPGISLVRYADGSVSDEERAEPRLSSAEMHPWANENSQWPSAIGNLFSLATGDLHYIVDGRGTEYLYDLSADVFEQNNLADSAAFAPRLEWFRNTLDSLVLAEDGTRRVRAPR
jgi:arylsulfatase A-like enzyme